MYEWIVAFSLSSDADTYIHTYKQTDRQTDGQTDRRTDRETDTDRQTDRQTSIMHLHVYIYIHIHVTYLRKFNYTVNSILTAMNASVYLLKYTYGIVPST